MRVRFIILAARLFGTAAVSELVKALEETKRSCTTRRLAIRRRPPSRRTSASTPRSGSA